MGQAAVFRHWAYEDGREGGPDSGAAPEETGPPTAEQLAAAEEGVAEQARSALCMFGNILYLFSLVCRAHVTWPTSVILGRHLADFESASR